MFTLKKFSKYFLIALFLLAENTQNCEKEDIVDNDGANMKLRSSAFGNMERIPEKYSCDNDNTPPPLEIQGVPNNAKSLALIMEDPDTPHGLFVHWVVWNIPPNSTTLDAHVGTKGKNGLNDNAYKGPCPPPGDKPHRYFFKLYALDKSLELPASTHKKELEEAMKGHIIAETQIVGTFSRGG